MGGYKSVLDENEFAQHTFMDYKMSDLPNVQLDNTMEFAEQVFSMRRTYARTRLIRLELEGFLLWRRIIGNIKNGFQQNHLIDYEPKNIQTIIHSQCIY